MDINELQNAFNNLEGVLNGYIRMVNENNEKIKELQLKAAEYRRTAESILDRCAAEEDALRVSDMVNQARAYISRAESCENSIRQLEANIQNTKSAIRGCGSTYESYLNEAQSNIKSLVSAMQKLNAASGSYGSDRIAFTIDKIKQRGAAYQQIANACRNRLTWIKNI